MSDSPRSQYESRLRSRRAAEAADDRLDRRLGDARLVAFGLALAVAWPALMTRTLSLAWLAAPLILFAALIVWHSRVRKRLESLRRGIDYFERGLARLRDEWPEPLDSGERHAPEDHPYATDLDLFGERSLYSRLCTANSLPGRERLAGWLLAAAPVEEIRDRQRAVAELTGRLDLREELALLAADLSPRLSEERLESWGGSPRRLAGLGVPLAAALLGSVNLAAFCAWVFGPLEGRWLLAILALSALLAVAVRGRVGAVLAELHLPAGELRFLAAMLARLERESFTSPRLATVEPRAGQPPPSRRLAELARFIEWNDSRRNQFFMPLAAMALVGTQLAYAVERWRARHGGEAGSWLRAIGDVEALMAFATLAFENPDYSFPELISGPPRFVASGLVHPMLPRARRVANDVRLAGGRSQRSDGRQADTETGAPALLLISGSNMSGKSTLLRTVGVGAVLAFAGAPVPAAAMRLTPLAVGASIEVHDSLLDGVSRFYAELQQIGRVRRLVAAGPALFLLDEILHGTNSHDRRLGAAGVIRALLADGAIGLVTTHDLALAEVADGLGERAANVHFEDHLEGDRMAFDYRLRPGVVARGNALALMRSLGLPVEPE